MDGLRGVCNDLVRIGFLLVQRVWRILNIGRPRPVMGLPKYKHNDITAIEDRTQITSDLRSAMWISGTHELRWTRTWSWDHPATIEAIYSGGFANDITKCANDSERSVYWNGTYFFLTGGFNGRVREMWFAGDSQAYGAHGFAYYNIIYIKN